MNNIKDEGIKYYKKYEKRPELSKEYLKDAIQFVLNKVEQNLASFTYKFPDYGKEQKYGQVDNILWTSSFWTGMLWLAYEITGESKFLKVAQIHTESFKNRIERRNEVDHHDLGFLYSLSCVADYKLTGNPVALETAVKASDHLMTRFLNKAGIIQAWGDLSDPAQRGRMIIDCCLNLPLLYWTSDITGDKKYYEAAYRHAMQAANYLVRPDASTYHTFYMDAETGLPKHGKTAQGYSDESCWSRGQAWAIYGFPLSYKYSRDVNFINIARKVTNYFLNRLPDDDVCYWDLIFTEGTEERDSSAAAIAACGLLEIVKYLPAGDEYKHIYENAALKIIKSLADNYTSRNNQQSNAVLLHAVGSKPHNSNVDEPLIFGDYYYLEALVRLYKDWELYW